MIYTYSRLETLLRGHLQDQKCPLNRGWPVLKRDIFLCLVGGKGFPLNRGVPCIGVLLYSKLSYFVLEIYYTSRKKYILQI